MDEIGTEASGTGGDWTTVQRIPFRRVAGSERRMVVIGSGRGEWGAVTSWLVHCIALCSLGHGQSASSREPIVHVGWGSAAHPQHCSANPGSSRLVVLLVLLLASIIFAICVHAYTQQLMEC